ncbi:peptide ABC transporter permease [Falsiroseomonas bella]|uniref:Peptide ABC transporter permease n=1 Tax=Falsiroseomonas bella TaxID=2184016 RepID=A0A317FJI3_9PROT|nr:ABC transporter permease [Falsiroseomonas bella]PWS39160.1 peptide ABC transporter permease [Falsiroseomonas bella]
MARMIAQRLLAFLPVLLLVLLIVFALSRLIPGDPATTLLGPGATADQIAALRAQLRLDEPPLSQFFSYLWGVLQGDLGRSLKSGAAVTQELLERLPATLELAISATLVALVIGIPIGVLSAIRANTPLDHGVRIVSLAGVSMPAFLLAVLLQLVFGIWLGWLPISGRNSPYFLGDPVTGFAVLDGFLTGDPEAAWDAARHLVLPVMVLAAFLAATLARFVRNAMLEAMAEDYIRTARSKGLPERSVIFIHGLRNALLPALTVLGIKFAELLGGAILTETVFAWPGVGRYMFDAIRNRDYPVVQGATLVFALLFMLVSLGVDLLHAALDPRIRRRVGQ